MKRIVQTSDASQQLDNDSSSISLNRVQIESALVRLQFSGRLQYLTAEKSDEVAQMVVRFAKGLRELPNK